VVRRPFFGSLLTPWHLHMHVHRLILPFFFYRKDIQFSLCSFSLHLQYAQSHLFLLVLESFLRVECLSTFRKTKNRVSLSAIDSYWPCFVLDRFLPTYIRRLDGSKDLFFFVFYATTRKLKGKKRVVESFADDFPSSYLSTCKLLRVPRVCFFQLPIAACLYSSIS